MNRRFALLDRDGTLIEERYYLSDPAGVKLIAGAGRALKKLKELGLGLAVITNQAGVGRGFFDAHQLDLVHRRMAELLENEGVHLDGIYVCVHAPDYGCLCRKPKLGLLEQARREHDFDSAESFVIGDKAIDIDFGRAAGATTFLVRTGYGTDVERQGLVRPDYVVDDLLQAGGLIRKIMESSTLPKRNE